MSFRIVLWFQTKIVMILKNMVPVPVGHESKPRGYVHTTLTTIIATMSATFLTHALLSLTQGTLTYINIHIVNVGWFSWKNGNRCKISDYLSIYIVTVVALFTGFIMRPRHRYEYCVCTLCMITLLFTMALYGFKASHSPFNIGS